LDANIDNETTPLCSSTSNIKASLFTENLRHRAQCLVAHPINPPHLIPAVEVVPAPWTSPQTVQRVRSLLQSVGQAPIVLKKEIDGFIVNRLQYAVLGEAFRLIEDDVIDPNDLDLSISHGLGCRWAFMGPFHTIDLNAPNGVEDYCQRYMGGVASVLKTEDNSRRPWENPRVVEVLTKTLREEVPLSRLPQRMKWRDQQLMYLARWREQLDAEQKSRK
jgi:3-hydroxyacyl-CoA dehydrogenase